MHSCSNVLHYTIGWRRDEHGIHKQAHGLFCIMCSLENNAFSVLHYVIKLTLHYIMLRRFEIHSGWELSRTALLCCRLAASRLHEAARCHELLLLFLLCHLNRHGKTFLIHRVMRCTLYRKLWNDAKYGRQNQSCGFILHLRAEKRSKSLSLQLITTGYRGFAWSLECKSTKMQNFKTDQSIMLVQDLPVGFWYLNSCLGQKRTSTKAYIPQLLEYIWRGSEVIC